MIFSSNTNTPTTTTTKPPGATQEQQLRSDSQRYAVYPRLRTLSFPGCTTQPLAGKRLTTRTVLVQQRERSQGYGSQHHTNLSSFFLPDPLSNLIMRWPASSPPHHHSHRRYLPLHSTPFRCGSRLTKAGSAGDRAFHEYFWTRPTA